VVIDIIDPRSARMLMCAGLRIRVRMNKDAMTVILMHVLKRCQAQSQHEGNARL
jgi:hypothetical protein